MITTVGKAKQIRCPMDIGKGNGNCQPLECLAWEFYTTPQGITVDKKPHGMRDSDKLGYCGLSKRR